MNHYALSYRVNFRILISILAFITVLLLTGASGPGQVLAMEARDLQAASNPTTVVSTECPEGVQGVCFTFVASGAVNIMGPASWTLHVIQDSFPTPSSCAETTVEVTLVGSTGSITLFSDDAPGCPSPTPTGFPFHASGDWVITDGTGEFSDITGSGSLRAVILPNGKNVVHISGTVSY